MTDRKTMQQASDGWLQEDGLLYRLNEVSRYLKGIIYLMHNDFCVGLRGKLVANF
jgi:hypothetical protein